MSLHSRARLAALTALPALTAALGLPLLTAPASAAASEVHINEVESNGDSAGDWVEILNTGTTAVDVSGWGVLDDDSSHTPARIPSGTVLQPGAYYVVTVEPGFGLGAADQARLLTGAGTVVDSTSLERAREHDLGPLPQRHRRLRHHAGGDQGWRQPVRRRHPGVAGWRQRRDGRRDQRLRQRPERAGLRRHRHPVGCAEQRQACGAWCRTAPEAGSRTPPRAGPAARACGSRAAAAAPTRRRSRSPVPARRRGCSWGASATARPAAPAASPSCGTTSAAPPRA
ncbi:lamin tail domain-containing protein [Nocardioides convexus]|uniref:lamin tail domain-containing protein n=1 Tax=Nocardioides convexus TaxID=2712224 RepID=UPI0024184E8C|nr:lamin tail domain-containing protein [Nocardioides convexus]